MSVNVTGEGLSDCTPALTRSESCSSKKCWLAGDESIC